MVTVMIGLAGLLFSHAKITNSDCLQEGLNASGATVEEYAILSVCKVVFPFLCLKIMHPITNAGAGGAGGGGG